MLNKNNSSVEFVNTEAEPKQPTITQRNTQRSQIHTGKNKSFLKVANRIAKLFWIYTSNLDNIATPRDVINVLDNGYKSLNRCEKLPCKFANSASATFKLRVPDGLGKQYLDLAFC